jgi:hypothetical protein
VHELTIGAHPEKLRIACPEFLVELAERRNFGGADEGEVLRPEKDDLPLACEAVVRKGLQSLGEVVRDDTGEGISREFLTNAQHVSVSVSAVPCDTFGVRRA